MEEIGRVTEYGEDTHLVRIEIEAKGACQHCSSRNFCSPFGDNRRMITEAINEKGARPGDMVRIEMEPKSTLSAAFLLYVLPVLALLSGYALGVSLTGRELHGIIAAIIALAGSFVLLRALNPIFARGRRFKPVVIEIIREGATDES
jgi:sigma-E factor negative regulatory protein RseC